MRSFRNIFLAIAAIAVALPAAAQSWAFRKDASDQHGAAFVTSGAAAVSLECLRPGFDRAHYGRANGVAGPGLSRPGVVGLVAEARGFPGAVARGRQGRVFITVTIDGQNQFFREAVYDPRRGIFVAELFPGDSVITALRAGGFAQIRVQGEPVPMTVRLGGSGTAIRELERYCGTPV